MANPFYDTRERAEQVQRLFGLIAPRYDLLNDLQSLGLHRRWKRRVAKLAKLRQDDEVLDVCCGTGDLAFELAAQGGKVTALDFSEPMLEIARARAESSAKRGNKSSGAIKFILGDAMELPFDDDQFDAVTIGYGLRNLRDWRRGLAEMARVAKPGGRLISLEFGKPENGLWRGMYYTYLRMFVPLLGMAVARNAAAYGYILESLKHFPAQQGVAEEMRQLGCGNIQVLNIFGGVMAINYGEKERRKGAE